MKGVVACEVITREPDESTSTVMPEDTTMAETTAAGTDIAPTPVASKKSRRKKRRGSAGVGSAAKRTKELDYELEIDEPQTT